MSIPGSQPAATKVRLTSILPGFDLATVPCAAESRLHESIHGNADFVRRLQEFSSERESAIVRGRLSLMMHGYRVDAAITPRLAELGVVLTRALRVVQPLDIFVVPDNDHNAYCIPSRKGNRLVMCLNSGLVSKLSPQEMLFVMGHEAGHAILRHTETPDIDLDDVDFSPLEVVQMKALRRAREISCDRFGLLACQDVRVACAALFKVASGLSDKWITFDEIAYSRHFDDIASQFEVMQIDGALQSHPLSPLRVKSLISFSKSRMYADAFGLQEWAVSDKQLEDEIDNMLSVTVPDFTDLESEDEKAAANRFLITSAIAMIGADGVVSPDEVAWLKQRASAEWSAEELEGDLMTPRFRQHLQQRLEKDAVVIANKCPLAVRAGLLRLICDVAICAGGIVEEEFDVLNGLRAMLQVPVEVAQNVLNQSSGSPEPDANEAETAVDSEGREAGIPPAQADQKPKDPLEAILLGSRLTDKGVSEACAFCNQIREAQIPMDIAVRSLISWAVRSSGSQGPLTPAQAKRLVTAAIQVCTERQSKNGTRRHTRSVPLDQLVRKHGPIVLFSRNETVYRGIETRPFVILSISRVNNSLVIAPADDLQSTVEVATHELRKDPESPDWPPELSLD